MNVIEKTIFGLTHSVLAQVIQYKHFTIRQLDANTAYISPVNSLWRICISTNPIKTDPSERCYLSKRQYSNEFNFAFNMTKGDESKSNTKVTYAEYVRGKITGGLPEKILTGMKTVDIMSEEDMFQFSTVIDVESDLLHKIHNMYKLVHEYDFEDKLTVYGPVELLEELLFTEVGV